MDKRREEVKIYIVLACFANKIADNTTISKRKSNPYGLPFYGAANRTCKERVSARRNSERCERHNFNLRLARQKTGTVRKNSAVNGAANRTCKERVSARRNSERCERHNFNLRLARQKTGTVRKNSAVNGAANRT